MTDNSTINKPRTVIYTAIGLTPTLTDLKIVIVPPSGTAPTVTFTAVAGHPGTYIAIYTPTVLGVYQEYISSVSNGDNLMDAYLVVSADTSDNEVAIIAAQAQITALAAQVTTMQANITTMMNQINKRGGYIN
jgi:hypothetical protein